MNFVVFITIASVSATRLKEQSSREKASRQGMRCTHQPIPSREKKTFGYTRTNYSTTVRVVLQVGMPGMEAFTNVSRRFVCGSREYSTCEDSNGRVVRQNQDYMYTTGQHVIHSCPIDENG